MVKRYIFNSYQASKLGYKQGPGEQETLLTRFRALCTVYISYVVLAIVGSLVIMMRILGLTAIAKYSIRLVSKLILYNTGVQMKTLGKLHPDRPLLVICNHSSWLDTIVVHSMIFCKPVYKNNLDDNTVLSFVLKFVDGMSIDPSRRSLSLSQCQSVHQSLQKNQNVLIYPEGLTSKGGLTSKFLPTLLASITVPIHDKMVKTQPVAIKYQSVRHINSNRVMRNQLSWQSSRPLHEHCFLLACHQSMQVVTTILPPCVVKNYQDRYRVSQKLQYAMQLALNSAAFAHGGKVQKNKQ